MKRLFFLVVLVILAIAALSVGSYGMSGHAAGEFIGISGAAMFALSLIGFMELVKKVCREKAALLR